jgi:hypothetical protein
VTQVSGSSKEDWVIDTCVVAETNKPSSPYFWDAMRLLMNVAENYSLAVDYENEIYKEYEPHMPFNSFARQWWIMMLSRAKVEFRSSGVPHSVRHHLVKKLKFDSDDLKFVGVAYRTSRKRLVSRDSDYNADIVKCLNDLLGVTYLDIPTACSNCS